MLRRTPWTANFAIPIDVGRYELFVPNTSFANPAIIYETVWDSGGRLIQFEGAPCDVRCGSCGRVGSRPATLSA